MTHQVKALAITEADLEKLRLLARSQVINNTYTPKVEVHSQKSHTPQQPTTTNSQELEL